MDKPQKPTNLLPRSFGGQKEAFDADKIAKGYQPDVPDILGGANLNDLLDKLGKELEYTETIADFVNGLPIGNVITTDENNKLIYINKSNLGYADANLTNLTPAGEKHFINKTQLTNAILETPNGVCTYTGNTITAKSGLKVLAPNGRNADGSLKNIEYTLASDSSKELSSAGTGLSVFFLRSLDNGQTWDIGYRSYGTQWYIQEEQPQVEHCEWYNPKTNLWKHCVSGEWSDILICPLGRVSCNEGQILSLYNYETIDLLKRSDRGEIIEWDRPNLTAGITKLFNTTYTAEEDGWLQSLTILVAQTSASAGTSSTIDVSTTIDGVEVYHNKAQIVNTSGAAVETATQTANIVRIHKGQQYRMFQSYKAGTSNIQAHALTFYPLLHE